MVELKGKITISRVHSNMEDDVIEVRINDTISAREFVVARLSLTNYAMASTGMACVECDLDVRGLDRVGMRMEHTKIEFPMPKHEYSNHREKAIEASKSHIPDGWTSDDYFGSQGSFFQRDGQEWARVTIRRWVEPKEV